jgi:hypothetical protein
MQYESDRGSVYIFLGGFWADFGCFGEVFVADDDGENDNDDSEDNCGQIRRSNEIDVPRYQRPRRENALSS